MKIGFSGGETVDARRHPSRGGSPQVSRQGEQKRMLVQIQPAEPNPHCLTHQTH